MFFLYQHLCYINISLFLGKVMFKFNKIQLFGFKKETEVQLLKQQLEALGISVVDHPEAADLLIVLGGDGTILHQAKFAHQYQIPILGINLGTVGFLADIDCNLLAIEAILKGEYIEDSRQVLRCTLNDKTHYAINEVMMCKASPVRMIQYDLYVDGQFVYQQTADGIIVATTTGSSAYALSAGGQLIHPKAKALSLVPICPNKITSCPLILDESAKIEIVLSPWKDAQAAIAIDAIEVENSPRICVELDQKQVTFLRPMDYDYYKTLQQKLHWEKK